MRRAFAIATLTVIPIVAGACRSDGRTLRPPPDNRRGSISVPSTPSTVVDEPGIDDGGETPSIEAPTIVAPWISGDPIPAAYTCDGPNGSPPLSWGEIPEGTAEIAITVTDDDAPSFVHWAIAGLGPATTSIAEKAAPVGAVQSLNGSGRRGYTGPCPPAGMTHTYRYTVHFLDQQIELGNDAIGSTMLDAINAATIDYAETVGTYTRPGKPAAATDATT